MNKYVVIGVICVIGFIYYFYYKSGLTAIQKNNIEQLVDPNVKTEIIIKKTQKIFKELLESRLTVEDELYLLEQTREILKNIPPMFKEEYIYAAILTIAKDDKLKLCEELNDKTCFSSRLLLPEVRKNIDNFIKTGKIN
jgi:hypothetical protein